MNMTLTCCVVGKELKRNLILIVQMCAVSLVGKYLCGEYYFCVTGKLKKQLWTLAYTPIRYWYVISMINEKIDSNV